MHLASLMAGVFVYVEKSRSDFHWLVATIKAAAAAACVYSTITSESQTAIFLHDMIQFIKSRAPAERRLFSIRPASSSRSEHVQRKRAAHLVACDVTR